MITTEELQALVGHTVYASDGDKIGKIGQVWLNDATSEPEFVTVSAGLLGNDEYFVPIAQATANGDSVTLPFSKDQVKAAPQFSGGTHITGVDGRAIYDHYQLPYAGAAAASGEQNAYGDPLASDTPVPDDASSLSGETVTDTTTTDTTYDTSYDTGTTDTTTTDTTYGTTGTTGVGESMTVAGEQTAIPEFLTRAEEVLQIGTERQEVGRARLRKRVVTEPVSETVQLTRDRAYIETVDLTDDDIAQFGATDLLDEDFEVVLHEDRPVVQRAIRPVERIRLVTRPETYEHQVDDQVRREVWEWEGDLEDRRPI